MTGSVSLIVDLIGKNLIATFFKVMDIITLVAQTFLGVLVPPYRFRDFIRQLYFVANESLGIIVICVSFAAVVTILEASFHMKMVVKDDSMVPGFAALLILRELGAIVSALLLTSRVGAGYAAEIGSMKITEQIDALKLLGIDPVRFLVVPRFLACMVGGALISTLANIVCIYCAMLVSEVKLGYGSGIFLMAMGRFVGFQDLFFAAIKGGVFGAIIPLVSCYNGFRCQAGAEGVGRATTNSVVAASVLVILSDFVLSYIFSSFY